MLISLCSGATLCILDQHQALIEDLTALSITHAQLPAPVLMGITAQPLPSLKVITVGAAACPAETARTWSSGRKLVNVYGPTETTICATAGEYSEVYGKPPIGRALDNISIYIFDENLGVVPIGLPGELYISGLGVSRGYLDAPGLTADRFLPNPYSNTPGERMYRTGDIAYWLSDGNIEFLGRGDDQVKIRGYRVELGEIEAKLRSHLAIREAVVITHRMNLKSLEPVLVAYVVLHNEACLSEEELQDYAKNALPAYMVPATCMIVDELPLLPSGKIDRSALPELLISRRIQNDDYVAPSTPTEKVLAKIMAEVLGVELVGVSDDFFELGGHSLLVTQVISRIRSDLHVNLAMKTLFEVSTIADLSLIVDFIKPDSVCN